MTCPICGQTVGPTYADLGEHLYDECQVYRAQPYSTRRALFRVFYNNGSETDVAYAGLDGRQAWEFFKKMKAAGHSVLIYQDNLQIGEYIVHENARSAIPGAASSKKGRVTPALASSDPHKYCRYVGLCIPNFLDPHASACNPSIP